MTDLAVPSTPSSPFDSIKRIGDNGQEYWSARDLMPLLGYDKWERFEETIERAMLAIQNTGSSAGGNASRLREASGKTVRTDFHLSRFGAYMTAMNGDPRKVEVAAAQSYFAVKTRQAELAAEPPSWADALQGWAREIKAREATEALVKELAPKADFVDRFVSSDDLTKFRDAANKFAVGEHALRDQLIEKRWIYRTLIGKRWSTNREELVEEWEWRCYADRREFFRLIPQHKAPRHHNNQLRQTLYITPAGLAAIGDLLSKVEVTA
jgi:DNA-damage-inducible protein D